MWRERKSPRRGWQAPGSWPVGGGVGSREARTPVTQGRDAHPRRWQSPCSTLPARSSRQRRFDSSHPSHNRACHRSAIPSLKPPIGTVPATLPRGSRGSPHPAAHLVCPRQLRPNRALRLTCGQNRPEPDVAVPEVGRRVAAVSRPAEPPDVAPTVAAQDTGRA